MYFTRMKIKIILILILTTLPLSACKVLKTHVIKLTGSAQIQVDAIVLATSKGRVSFSTQNMTEQQKALLQNLRPYQCLEIKTPEQFAMQNREVTFYDFKLKSLVESHQDCRKIKISTRLEIH